MRGSEWIYSLLRAPQPIPAPSWADVLGQVRAEHGRGATRYLAGRMGVTMRTAQRYYTGQHVPTRAHAVAAMRAEIEQVQANRHQQAADKYRRDTADMLRLIDTLDVGRLRVLNLSGPRARKEENRFIRGKLRGMGPGLAVVADHWEAGNVTHAEKALSDAVLAVYNGDSSDEPHSLGDVLHITDYPIGMDYE